MTHGPLLHLSLYRWSCCCLQEVPDTESLGHTGIPTRLMQQPDPAAPAGRRRENASQPAVISDQPALASMSSSTPGSTIGQPLLASEMHTGASASTCGEEADVLRSFAEAGTPHSADAIRQLSLQGELRAVSLRIDAITGEGAASLLQKRRQGNMYSLAVALQILDTDVGS